MVNTFRIRNANDDITPVWHKAESQTKLVTHYVGMKPYVEVSVNGVGGFRFLIDTGASFSILNDSEKVKQLNLKQGYPLQFHGWGDEEHSPGYQVKTKQISLAGIEFDDVSFAYLPLSTSNYFIHSGELTFDGVLGHDVLRHFSWTFNKKTKQISIANKPYKLTGEEISIPFEVSFSKLVINSEIDFGHDQQVTQELMIDTGSRHYLKVNAAFIHNEKIKIPEPQITAADFGLSGQTIHQRVTLPNLKIGHLNISNVKANIIGSVDGDEDEFWIVGSALLNQYISVIDYHSSMLHLIPYHDSSFESLYNLLGLELRKLSEGSFIIRYVFPQMAANDFDFKKGDLISKIDGKLAQSISQKQWLNISNRVGIHTICRIRKTEKCFALESRHIQGYSLTSRTL